MPGGESKQVAKSPSKSKKNLKLLMTNIPCHIETSQLICSANQLTGFYMIENIGC